MKILLVLAWLTSGSAMAAECPKFFVCGSYEGKGQEAFPKNNSGEYTETVVITGEGPLAATINVAWQHADGDAREATFNASFREDGSFDLNRGGQVAATGQCAETLCTVNFGPYRASNGKLHTNTHVLLFAEGQLEHLWTYSSGLGVSGFQRALLQKK